jgi:hypothetical protein
VIICPNQGFVFVHIPKCAGSTVRRQIVKCDPDHISMGDVHTHPVLGKLDYGHVPLPLLRQYFPEAYGALESMDSFAVVRDPLTRFGSALRQILWQYEGRPMTLIPAAELREITVKALDRIAREIDAPSAPYIFFARQTDFLFDGETRVTQHLVPMQLVPEFLGYLSRRTGIALETGMRANQNVELRVKGRLGQVAYRLNHRLSKVLPGDTHARIKTAALKVLAKKSDAAQASGVLDIPELRDFVTEHYARDAALYAQASAQAEALRRAFAQDRLPEPPLV